MRAGVFLLLSSLLLLSGLAHCKHARGHNDANNDSDNDNYRQQGQVQSKPKPFQAGYEYSFTYNGQIASGVSSNEESEIEPEQKSATRIQSQCRIVFDSDRQATLRLEQIRIGQLNKRIDNPEQVQPMGMFEPKQLQEEKRRKLELPCQFSYADGVVESIQFHPDDSAWSRNIKRAVLNLIQLNMKRNRMQGLEVSNELNDYEQQQQSQESDVDSQQQLYQTFTLPETTIEGQCLTTYTVNSAQKFSAQRQSEGSSSSEEGDDNQQGSSSKGTFNVTKSINFKQCTQIADVAFGFQTQQPQPQCARCQLQWLKQQGTQRSDSGRQQNLHPCSKCDSKVVKEEKLGRSTVLRYVLVGKPEVYAIKRSELISKYVFKNLRADTNGEYGAAMHTVVAAELVFRSAQQANQKSRDQLPSGGQSESLLYDNDWDVTEKRFYMYGDEAFSSQPLFRAVTNKVEQAQQMIRKLAQAAADKANGIETDVVVQLQRLVELLRMATVEELKQIQRGLARNTGNQFEKQTTKQILADALAIAGTRNTIAVLVEQIVDKSEETHLESHEAIQALQSLRGLPAPSEKQVELVYRLCKNEIAHRSSALKQTCWLTVGSMVGELCQQPQQAPKYSQKKSSDFGGQSDSSEENLCAQHKETYKKIFEELYTNAQSTYEKVLALKTIGNAAIDRSVPLLKRIIHDNQESRIVRVQAIDALRRLRNLMPRKIQSILLPIFENTREHPQTRMAAFAMLMHTTPEQQIVDQVTYTLSKERSQDVKSFVYTTMKLLIRSKVAGQRHLARQVKQALKVANVDEASLHASAQYELPIYSQQEDEGLFLQLASVFVGHGMLPDHLSASLHSMLNGDYEMNNVKIGFTQQEADNWYERLMRNVVKLSNGNYRHRQQPAQKTRAQRLDSSPSFGQKVRDIFSGLGITSRRSSSSSDHQAEGSNSPFAMVNLRIGDVDHMILPIDDATMRSIEEILSGEKSIWKSYGENNHFRTIIALNPNEKAARIPTSIGLSLRLLQSTPILVNIDGQLKTNVDSSRLESSGMKAQLSVHPNVAISHFQCMETWMPVVGSGVESTRTIEINLPIQAEISTSSEGGLQLALKTPQAEKTRIFGAHTLATTYTRDFDSKMKLLRDPKVKTIHVEQLEQLQGDFHKVLGVHSFGVPIHIKGHGYWPAQITDYKQVVQLMMSTQNHVHITIEPDSNTTPREIVFRANGKLFQKVSGNADSPRPDLYNFYSNDAKFEQAHPEDFEDMELENQNERRQKFSTYLDKFQPSKMYKHELTLSTHTTGGSKQFKARMSVEGACDAKFKYCKAQTTIQRSPMYSNENSDWNLEANMQTLTPDSVTSVKQLSELDSKRNRRFAAQADLKWGVDHQQKINLRIEGESVKTRKWRQQIDDEDLQQRSYNLKRSAFLNKFDTVVIYKLQPHMQNLFNRAFEYLKHYDFWSTQTQLLENGRDGQLRSTVVIDPISLRHANLSIKSPSQSVKIQSFSLPITVRPFPLIRRQSDDKSTHSMSQFLTRLSSKGRAECSVDGKRVETFDGVLYRAPISSACYSVLAKDCTTEEPKFVVLMKQMNNELQDKKVKVITPEQTIECQPKQSSATGEKQIRCQVNGQTVEGGDQQQRDSTSGDYPNSADVIEYNNDEQTDVTINVEGVSVRFGCYGAGCSNQKAWIKISSEYKNGQCGLCGHYDDQPEDEWRMGNNQRTSDLSKFHQSYSLQDDEECDANKQQSFYADKKGQFAAITSSEFDYHDDQQNDDGEEREWRENAEEESQEWDGQQSSRSRQQWGKKRSYAPYSSVASGSVRKGLRRNDNTQEAVEQTKVIEYNHKICFSLKPIKQCPEGTMPISSSSSSNKDGGDEYSGADRDNDQQSSSGGRKEKVQFACLSRTSSEAKRLQRQAHNGVIVDIENQKPSFVETVQQPLRCVQY